MKMKTINLGCGFHKMDGSVNVDIRKECNPDYIVDFNKDKIPFKDNTFDKAICSHVMEHLVDLKFFVREVRRILKKNGVFILSVAYHGLIKNLMIALLYFDNHYNPNEDHLRFFTKKSLTTILYKNGFVIKRVEYNGRINFLWSNMRVISIANK